MDASVLLQRMHAFKIFYGKKWRGNMIKRRHECTIDSQKIFCAKKSYFLKEKNDPHGYADGKRQKSDALIKLLFFERGLTLIGGGGF